MPLTKALGMAVLRMGPVDRSIGQGAADVAGEVLEEGIRLLLDDGLPELADLPEEGEVRLDGQRRGAVGGGGQAHPGPRTHAPAQLPIRGVRPKGGAPRLAGLFLDRDVPLQPQADRPEPDAEDALVSVALQRLHGLHAGEALADARDVHQEVPEPLARHGDGAYLAKRHRAPWRREAPRAPGGRGSRPPSRPAPGRRRLSRAC